jgi:glutamate racemase
MWVPLIEANELDNEGAEYFVKKHINQLFTQSKDIDAVILGCTHYPLLRPLIEKHLPEGVVILAQGSIVTHGLKDYLFRHPEMEAMLTKNNQLDFLTTDSAEQFDRNASLFFGKEVNSKHLSL